MKKSILATIIAISSFNVYSQSNSIIKDENSILKLLKKDSYQIDSNAKAVILSKTVVADYYGDTYVYSIDFVAKILSDEAAKDLSEVNAVRTKYANVHSISAETYNLENGKVVRQELNSDEIKKDKFTDGLDVFKFNLPSVKKGSVIHYKYKVTDAAAYSIPDYYLQTDYPILFQSYEVIKPEKFKYANIERMNIPIKRAKSKSQLEDGDASYYSEVYGGGRSYEIWVRRNEPAFKKEPLMGASVNYKERIRIQIKTLTINSYLDNWDFYNKTYVYDNDNFVGQVFKGNGFLGDKIKELTKGKPSDIEKAKAIYAFVRDSFNIKYTGKEFSLRTIFSDRVGSENEINLLLTAMLRKAEFNANPVFLSPKPGEKLNPVYPDNQNTKVIIAAVRIGNQDIYLDASKKQLPFNVLLPENYNGYARLIDRQSKGIELDPNSCIEKSVALISLKPGANTHELVLKYDAKPGNVESYNFRSQMSNDTSEIRKGIIKNLNKEALSYTLSDLKIENLRNPDAPLKVHFEATLNLEQDDETIYLNPFIDAFFDKNPLSSAERIYPIEMDYLDDKSYTFMLELPKEYVVDDYPKSAIYKMNDAGNMLFKNIYNYDAATNTLLVKSSLQNAESTYPPEAYEAIRSFYGKILECQNQKIVIKKQSLK